MSLAEQITRNYRGDWNASAGQGNIPGDGHSAGDRSVSVKDAPDRPDGILVHCRGAGDWRAELDRFRRDGLLSAFEPQRANGHDRGATEWRCTDTFEFDNGDEKVTYRTRRLEKSGEKKRYVAERLDAGRWVNGLGDTPRVLYRFTALRQALERAVLADQPLPPIYFVEGERKADKLASMGFVATAIAFGAKGWRAEYANVAALVDASVIMLPDNDDAGREFAGKVKAGIEAAGGTVHIVELPGLPPKGDIVDWSGTADELRRLTEDAINGKLVSLLPVINFATWQGTPPVAESAWGSWLPNRVTTMLTGCGGIGKSLAEQMLLTAVALGLPFLGMETTQANTLYVTCEDDADELWRRQAGICAWFRVPISALAGKLHIVSLCGETDTALATFDDTGRIHPTPRWRALEATCDALNIGVYAFDNATDAMAGDLNDIHQVAEFVNLLTGLAMRRNGVAMILHHPNKAGDDWLGSVAWHNKVRSRLIIERGENEDPDTRVILNPKANYGPYGGKIAFRWFRGAFILDSDLPPDTAADLRTVATANADNTAFLACLRVRASQGDGRAVGPSPGPNYAPAQFVGMAEAKGATKDRLKRAMDRLFTIGQIESVAVENRKSGRSGHVIREAQDISHNAAHNPRTSQPHNPAQPAAHPRTPHTVDTTYQSGAAHGSAAPNDQDDEGRLAPDDERAWEHGK